MYVLITCKYEKDPIKNSRENVMTSFFPLYVNGIFFRRSRAANSVVGGQIWPKLELIQDIMPVLITCKFEKDRINSNGDKVVTSIFRRSRAANSIVSGGIWPKFKLIQAFIHVLITCKYEKDPIKNSRENLMT